MTTELAAVICTGMFVVIAAIVKWPFRAEQPGPPVGTPSLCPEHSGLIERLRSGEQAFAQINKRLDEMERRHDVTEVMVREIHAEVVRR